MTHKIAVSKAPQQHRTAIQNIFIDPKFWQFVFRSIQIDMPLLKRRKKYFSSFFSVLFTNEKRKQFQTTMLTEKTWMACSLKPYFFTFKTTTL
jgi:hypothetical protein